MGPLKNYEPPPEDPGWLGCLGGCLGGLVYVAAAAVVIGGLLLGVWWLVRYLFLA
jgi:hypothetical protein